MASDDAQLPLTIGKRKREEQDVHSVGSAIEDDSTDNLRDLQELFSNVIEILKPYVAQGLA